MVCQLRLQSSGAPVDPLRAHLIADSWRDLDDEMVFLIRILGNGFMLAVLAFGRDFYQVPRSGFWVCDHINMRIAARWIFSVAIATLISADFHARHVTGDGRRLCR